MPGIPTLPLLSYSTADVLTSFFFSRSTTPVATNKPLPPPSSSCADGQGNRSWTEHIVFHSLSPSPVCLPAACVYSPAFCPLFGTAHLCVSTPAFFPSEMLFRLSLFVLADAGKKNEKRREKRKLKESSGVPPPPLGFVEAVVALPVPLGVSPGLLSLPHAMPRAPLVARRQRCGACGRGTRVTLQPCARLPV